MGKIYRCPICNGTDVTWDRGIGRAVCPNDGTRANNYKVVPEIEKTS